MLTAKGYVLISEVYNKASCSVYKASHPGCSRCPNTIAIKIQTYTNSTVLCFLHRELANMSAIQSLPHVIRLCEYFYEFLPDGEFAFVRVMEWVESDLMKELQQRKTNNDPWPEYQLSTIAKEVIATLAEAERRGIVHREITPRNIFLDPLTKTVKLGSFGPSQTEYSLEDMASLAGSPAFASTELNGTMLHSEGQRVIHRVKSDVFSLGLTLLTLAKLESPQCVCESQAYEDVLQQELSVLRYSSQVKAMIWDMMHPVVDERLTFQQLEAKYYIAPSLCADTYQRYTAYTTGYNHREIRHSQSSSVIPHSRIHVCCSCGGDPLQEGSIPVTLICPKNDVNAFCGQTCLRRFIEQSTSNYSKASVQCMACPALLCESDIMKEYGGREKFIRRKVEVTEKELFCVCCKARKATMVIECGHIYCEECVDVYKTGLFGRRGMICSECQKETNKRPEKIREVPKWSAILWSCRC